MRTLVLCSEQREAAAVLERLGREGRSIRSGWDLPSREWDVSAAHVVCTGRVETPEDAHAALLAAARGAGVVAVAGCEPRLLERFFEDLQRFGRVELRTDQAPEPPDPLGCEERRLLELLARGVTLGEAAKRLHISRRTADRRLAAARTALGVRTTAEAVVALGGEAGGGIQRVA
jgi:DNA-binding NarL/FixJ family response regulator